MLHYNLKILQDDILNSFLRYIRFSLKKELPFDYMMFITSFCNDSTITYFDIRGGQISDSPYKKNSLVGTTLAKLKPQLSNDINLIDNPFGYPVSSQIVIPCFIPDTKDCFGAIAICKESLNFSEDDMRVANSTISNLINKDFPRIEHFAKKFVECLNKASLSKISESIEPNQLREFFSSVIHDIRTPMNAVIGFLDLLREDDVTDTQREYINTALKSAEMVVALVNDVLDFNKIVSGNLDIDFHYFSLPEELKNSSLLFYHSARKKKIDLINYFDPHIPYMIKSDPFRVKQIINNLLSNAIKFTDVGGEVVLEVLYNEQKDILNINVKDSGIGIKESALDTIFEPFKQASSDTSSKYGGTGLGLSISKKLANMLGGDLTVKSKVGEGSTFTLTIPCHTIPGTPHYLEYSPEQFPPIYLVEGDESKHRYIKYFKRYFERLKIKHKALTYKEFTGIEVEPEAIIIAIKFNYDSRATQALIGKYHERLIMLQYKVFSHKEESSKNLVMLEAPIFPDRLFDKILNFGKEEIVKKEEKLTTNKSVLIVDDNAINQKLLDEVCSKMGAKTYIASDGKEAIDSFKEHPVDLIFIDQNMPILSGTEAIKQIRALPNGSRVAIYGLTGDADKETLEEMIKAGADDILTKPIKIKEIRNILLRG